MAQFWQWPAVETAAMRQGMAGGADAGHEQGSTAAGAHGKARARLAQVRQWVAVLEQGSDTRAAGQAELGYGTAVETEAQGLADAGPAGAAVLV